MTIPRNRKHLRDIITESVNRFGWWATLHECTEALRVAWRDETTKGITHADRQRWQSTARGDRGDARG